MTELAFPLALTRQNLWAGPKVVVWIVVETSEGFPRGLILHEFSPYLFLSINSDLRL